MHRRTQTMRDVGTIKQLHEAGQLVLATEFQRNAVWPTAAKAYLLDTVLSDRPIPYLYFRRAVSAQTGRSQYEVIDGQQRIRALLEFLDDGFALNESKDKSYKGRYFSQLTESQRAKVLSYDLYVEELTGYSDEDIEDMFVRMNRFVVKLSPQEIRHARFEGRFKDFTEELGKLPFWQKHNVFTVLQARRMRAVEFSAELVILIVEGPQDKKSALDLYYGQYEKRLPFKREVEGRLSGYLQWIESALPDLRRTRFRKPTDLYALLGALNRHTRRGKRLDKLDETAAGKALLRFQTQTQRNEPVGRAARYVAAASRQTDNIGPRLTRIDTLVEVLREA
jgi:uncharacterized protein DUF262